MKKLLLVVAVLGLGGAGFWYARLRGDGADARGVTFRTAKVERGEVVEGVEASGTVQPVVLVQVGTQVSGVIEEILVDFNSRVKAGDVVARIDKRRVLAQLVQDRASVARAKAELGRVKAQLEQAKKDRARLKSLFERGLVNETEYDEAALNVETLTGQLAISEAAVTQAEAALHQREVELEYCTIVSPIDGVVISRAVDVGQTVAASLSAPTLFTIANDLTKVQVQATVPEADIGKIKRGQRARFTVDAFPQKVFEGVVSQVRLAATTVQNVVTYTVLIDASNPEGLLIPGMTANATFEVARSAPDALHVSSAALRVKPDASMVLPGKEPAREERPRSSGNVVEAEERPAATAETSLDGRPERRRGGRGANIGAVYVQAGEGRLRKIPVRTGVSDGSSTVIEPLEPGVLAEGTEVVTAIIKADDGGGAVTNPFAPQRPSWRGGRR